ncbi:MAG: pyridoxal phosphate-dependent decarboxylase family protein [Nitrososphaerales archaeon]
MNQDIQREENLDPQDWDAMRALGRQMVDDMLGWLEAAREREVWQPVPDEVKAYFRQPPPLGPTSPDQVYEDFCRYILPYPMGNIHPRFWSWVMGNGTAFGMLAEMLAAGMNPNMGGGEHVGIYVERQVLDWTKALLGFPPTASGLLVSGGSMANLIAIAIARNVGAGVNVRAAGLQSCGDRLTLYASVETHSSVQKAVELLGLGHDNLRLIPVDGAFRIDLPLLEAAIARDRAAGLRPICLIGNAGTVNTGAIDPLDTLGEIARREGLWYHVDGAIGALSALAPDLEPKVAGMAQADSIALDFHKWLYAQFEAGCILVRDEAAHLNTFSLTPEYLEHGERGVSAGKNWPSEYGVQLTRSFRALKIWMSLREHGAEKYGRLISQNAAQVRYLGERVKETAELELLTPVQLNIACFRYNPGGRNDEALNALNKELLFRMHESGLAAPSYTTLNGRYWLRVANTNHRTRREDFDLLVREVLRLGREIASEG